MKRTCVLASAIVIVGVSLSAQQPRKFTYAGIGFGSDFDAVSQRFPHSGRTKTYIYVAPEDSHDRIGGIELSRQRVVISFATHVGDRDQYPPCVEIEQRLIRDYGRPESIREFDEEAVRRADRHWISAREEMTLVCFMGPRRQLLAEAVKILPR